MKFGQKIRNLRKNKGLTLRELAKRVGINFTYLSKIETGKSGYTPSVKTISNLAKSLEADQVELMLLANKITPGLEEIARHKEIIQFLRTASKRINTPDEWNELLSVLEEKKK